MSGAGWPKGKPLSEETKRKISLAMKGKTHSPQTIKRISRSMKRKFKIRKAAADAQQEQATS